MPEEIEQNNEAYFLWEDIAIRIYTELYSTYRQHGLIQTAIKIALETLLRFPNDPASYQNLADGLWASGLKNETREILQQAVERFPDDYELLAFLRDVEHDMDDPDGGETFHLFSLMLLTVLMHKTFKKKF